MTNTSITDKEWLDLAWKHFQQHAQQRIQYFNYFVIFSTIVTTGLVSTFQINCEAPYLGIGIGLLQAYLSFIFWKIDDRNRFLTKHAEKIIKKIEADYESANNRSYQLFTDEEKETKKQVETDRSKFVIWRQISHGKSYRIIFITFFIVGIIGTIIAFYNFEYLRTSCSVKETQIVTMLKNQNDRNDSISNTIMANQEKNISNINIKISNVEMKIDSVQKTIFVLSEKIKEQ